MTTAQQTPTTYDALVTAANGTRFYRVGRRVICIDDHETMVDVYADAATAQMILDMAAE